MNTTTSSENQISLPANFYPSSLDVICQKGRKAFNHPGNQVFRRTVALYSRSYQEAPNKVSKSIIVNNIVNWIRQNCTNGGRFVRFNNDNNTWYEIGDTLAREKVGYTIREELRKKDPVYMNEKRAKRRILKRQRTAERNRSNMTSIATTIAEADKDLHVSRGHTEPPSFVFGSTEHAQWQWVLGATFVTKDDSSFEPPPCEIPSEMNLPTLVEETTLTSGESQDWFTLDQMKPMTAGEEYDLSALFERESHSSAQVAA